MNAADTSVSRAAWLRRCTAKVWSKCIRHTCPGLQELRYDNLGAFAICTVCEFIEPLVNWRTD